MSVFIIFLLSFFFSFIGSIPPGTINLTVIQMGLDNKTNVAWRFALAAALIEYPYGWIAVKFEALITSSPWIVDNINLIGAIVMTLLGIVNLWPAQPNTSKLYKTISESGFRRGIILGILNPLAVPYWLGITAYLKSQSWIELSTTLQLHAYLLGVSTGGFFLLIIYAYIAKKIISGFSNNPWIKKIPGFVLLILGFYALMDYLL